jgi:hypothetical protein
MIEIGFLFSNRQITKLSLACLQPTFNPVTSRSLSIAVLTHAFTNRALMSPAFDDSNDVLTLRPGFP